MVNEERVRVLLYFAVSYACTIMFHCNSPTLIWHVHHFMIYSQYQYWSHELNSSKWRHTAACNTFHYEPNVDLFKGELHVSVHLFYYHSTSMLTHTCTCVRVYVCTHSHALYVNWCKASVHYYIYKRECIGTASVCLIHVAIVLQEYVTSLIHS